MQKHFLKDFDVANGVLPDTSELCLIETEPKRLDLKPSEQARSMRDEDLPIKGSVAGSYSRIRCITCPLAKSLRFHPKCWHGPTRMHHPAIMAAIRGGGAPAIHQTSLKANGSGREDLDGGDKLMLGAAAGVAVRLWPAQGRLVNCGAIEMGPSLLSDLLGKLETVLAALSAAGIPRPRLPESPDRGTPLVRSGTRTSDMGAHFGPH